MRSRSFILTFVASAAIVGILAVTAFSVSNASAGDVNAARVARGKYIVSAGGCHDCHTPLKMGANGPEPDFARSLMGHPEDIKITAAPPMAEGWMMAGAASGTAFAGPWGISFAANLTPDQNTGLGIWTEDMFMRAIREGRHMGVSRPILPPMPWPVFRNYNDEDLKSIYAYLRTIPAITNHVPEPVAPMLTENLAR